MSFADEASDLLAVVERLESEVRDLKFENIDLKRALSELKMPYIIGTDPMTATV